MLQPPLHFPVGNKDRFTIFPSSFCSRFSFLSIQSYSCSWLGREIRCLQQTTWRGSPRVQWESRGRHSQSASELSHWAEQRWEAASTTISGFASMTPIGFEDLIHEQLRQSSPLEKWKGTLFSNYVYCSPFYYSVTCCFTFIIQHQSCCYFFHC